MTKYPHRRIVATPYKFIEWDARAKMVEWEIKEESLEDRLDNILNKLKSLNSEEASDNI
jgi:hypothetical protein